MAKLNELIYDIREGLREFSDDSEIDNRYIIYLYNIKRSKYLRRDLNNYQKTTDNSIKQTLCLEMEEVSIDECGLDYNCETILRSVKPIPTPLELHTKVAITTIKPTNRISKPFNFVSKDRIPYIEGSSFSSSIYTFIDVDNHVYVYSLSDAYRLIECLTVTGIFENPLELENFSNCCGCSSDTEKCFDINNTEYPIQPHYIDLIREEIIKDLLITKRIPEDKTNDSTDYEEKNT